MNIDTMSVKCFIHNNIEIPNEILPFNIFNSIVIRNATAKEIEELKTKIFDIYGKSSPHLIYHIKNFYVITANGTNQQIIELFSASMLIKTYLKDGMILFYESHFQQGDAMLFTATEHSVLKNIAHESNECIKLDLNELEKLKRYMEYFNLEQHRDSFIKNTMDMFTATIKLPKTSQLLTLSYFSIIESLITNKPNPNDPNSSLTRQIQNKINLLSKRFDNQIDCNCFFGNITTANLWKRLYDLRSCIAHGEKYNFNSGEFQILKNIENVNQFLHEIVKELIKLAIDDTQLIEDLKKC